MATEAQFVKSKLADIRTDINDLLYYHTDNLKNSKTISKKLKVIRARIVSTANSL